MPPPPDDELNEETARVCPRERRGEDLVGRGPKPEELTGKPLRTTGRGFLTGDAGEVDEVERGAVWRSRRVTRAGGSEGAGGCGRKPRGCLGAPETRRLGRAGWRPPVSRIPPSRRRRLGVGVCTVGRRRLLRGLVGGQVAARHCPGEPVPTITAPGFACHPNPHCQRLARAPNAREWLPSDRGAPVRT